MACVGGCSGVLKGKFSCKGFGGQLAEEEVVEVKVQQVGPAQRRQESEASSKAEAAALLRGKRAGSEKEPSQTARSSQALLPESRDRPQQLISKVTCAHFSKEWLQCDIYCCY